MAWTRKLQALKCPVACKGARQWKPFTGHIDALDFAYHLEEANPFIEVHFALETLGNQFVSLTFFFVFGEPKEWQVRLGHDSQHLLFSLKNTLARNGQVNIQRIRSQQRTPNSIHWIIDRKTYGRTLKLMVTTLKIGGLYTVPLPQDRTASKCHTRFLVLTDPFARNQHLHTDLLMWK